MNKKVKILIVAYYPWNLKFTFLYYSSPDWKVHCCSLSLPSLDQVGPLSRVSSLAKKGRFSWSSFLSRYSLMLYKNMICFYLTGHSLDPKKDDVCRLIISTTYNLCISKHYIHCIYFCAYLNILWSKIQQQDIEHLTENFLFWPNQCVLVKHDWFVLHRIENIENEKSRSP